MKTLITVSVVIVTLLGVLGLYMSLKGDIATAPVVVTAAK